jgi:hypothetical protein
LALVSPKNTPAVVNVRFSWTARFGASSSDARPEGLQAAGGVGTPLLGRVQRLVRPPWTLNTNRSR